jgi:hypothetical protein
MPRRRLAASLLLAVSVSLTGCGSTEPEPEERVDIPIYPQSSTLRTAGEPGSAHHELYLSSGDTSSQIKDWYLEQFAREGWEVERSGGLGILPTIFARKRNRAVSVKVLEQRDRRVIHQVVQIKRRRALW